MPVNKLSDEERQHVLAIVNSKEFRSLPPSQIVPTLVDRGEYVASESTMYRLLHEEGQQQHRGPSAKPEPKPLTSHEAKGPNQVWSWDITWLPGHIKGTFWYLYLILDIFSRKIVGWEVWDRETSTNAATLITRAVLAEKLRGSPLVLHSDNGSPMKGATFLTTLQKLGVLTSYSRPRVSNDNPYSEALFRTCKYRANFPSGGFASPEEARIWVASFVRWYNKEHHHSSIGFVTPHQRHAGEAVAILAQRAALYARARTLHPERWRSGTRNWTAPEVVWLNPEKDRSTDVATKKKSS